MGVELGLSVSMLGAAIVAMLAGFCLLDLGSRAMTVLAMICFPLGCGISYLGIQLWLHGESLMAPQIRPFVIWILMLVIVQSLSLRRGFLHRFSCFALLLGLCILPYLVTASHSTARAKLESTVGMGHPNALAAWFGFCALYFLIVGVENKRNTVRLTSWLITVGCLFIMGLTVSRGALLAFAIAATVALGGLLKRGFVPVLVLLMLSWIIVESQLFDETFRSYSTRGLKETGRALVWPLAIERFFASPIIGVGASNAPTYVPSMGKSIQVHNGLIFLALASGVIPLAFFLAYWGRAALVAFRANAKRLTDAPFQLPLLIYAGLVTMTTNTAFLHYHWIVVVLSIPIAAGALPQVLRTRRNKEGYPLAGWGPTRYAGTGIHSPSRPPTS